VTVTETEGERNATPDFLAELARILSALGPSLALAGSTLLLPLLEGQRAFLRSYRQALEDPSFRHAQEEHARMLAKVLMASYLDLSRSQRENHDRLVAMRSTLITAYLEALDKALGRLRDLEG
jgi:hypothetical protein